jgi:Glycosyl hydrolases family 43/Carbohydrate binding domain/Carbohydrate binding module (family 6)
MRLSQLHRDMPRKRWLRPVVIAAAAVVLAGLFHGVARADDAVLLSSDFESGYTPWGARGPVTLALSDEAHNGSHSLAVSGRTASWNGPSASVTNIFQAGGTYQVTGWVKLPAGTEGSAGIHFTVQHTPADGSSTGYDWIGGGVATTAATWVQIGGSYTFPAGQSDAQLYVETDGTTDFLLDDVTVTGQPPAGADLLTNSGFEDGLTGWFANNGNPTDSATLSVTSDAYTGSQAVLVTNRTSTGSGPMQDVSGKVQAGMTYTASARVKYENPSSPATKQFFITMHYGGATYTNLATATVPRGQWGLIQGTFTIPAGQDVTTARIFLETPWTSDPSADPATHLMDFKADDVTLQEGTPPPAHPTGHAAPAKKVGNGNPLMDYQYGADPWAMVYNGRVYEYMTSDGAQYDANGNVVQTYEYDGNGNIKDNGYGQIKTLTILSSADLVNWTNEGQVKVAGSFGAAKWASNSWAPAAAHRTINGKEKFFLYFANSAGGIGVLTSDSPVGPWVDPIGKALVTGATPGVAGVVWLFDPAVLVDDDGSAYLYFGGGVPSGETDHPKTTRVIKLGDDMTSTVGTAATIDAPAAFEDSGINKINGRYYYSYCTNFSHSSVIDGNPIGNGNIAYMVSDNPMGPFTYQAQILSNPGAFFGQGGNNHHAMFEFNGQMYITYHAQTVQSALVAGGSLNTGHGYRSTHIDKVTINADGSIAPITGTYQGVPQQGVLGAHGRIEAETIAWDSGIQDAYVDSSGIRVLPLGSDSTGEQKLTNINSGEWTSLSKVDFGDEASSGGAIGLAADVLPKAGGQVEIRLDSADTSSSANLVGTLTIPASLAGTWTTVSTNFATPVTGVHNVFFVFKSTASNELFDVDDWQFRFDRFSGFYQPVDMNAVNTAKAGSTIPVKFEVFAGSLELTALSEIASITYTQIPADGSAPTDEIETVATGGTSLTYDTVAGVYQYNWKTPTAPGNYRLTVKTRDGSTLSADFRLR